MNTPKSTDKPRSPGRPPTWLTKIDAPASALRLYAMLAELQNSDAFRTCHPYSGAHTAKGVPLFKFEGRVHAMPYIIASHMGLEYGNKTCSTPGCVNPFHYAPPSERLPQDQTQFTPPQAAGSDWDDLILYYIEEVGVRPINFSALRAAIPVEDMDDHNLRTALQTYQTKYGHQT